MRIGRFNLFLPQIADFSDKLSGFADLKSTLDRGSAEKFGPDSGLCMTRSSGYGYFDRPCSVFWSFVDHSFSFFQFHVCVFFTPLSVLGRLAHFTFPFPPSPLHFAMFCLVSRKLFVSQHWLAVGLLVMLVIALKPTQKLLCMVVDRTPAFHVGVSSRFGRQVRINSKLSIN